MTVERRNPVPLGRYWVDIPQAKVPDFDAFLRDHGRGIFVMQTKETSAFSSSVTSYLFEIRDPLIWWNQSKFGFPTIATGINDLDQTAQVPAPEPVLPSLPSFEGIGNAVLVLGALWLLSQMGG
jgi:hypothetical protein